MAALGRLRATPPPPTSRLPFYLILFCPLALFPPADAAWRVSGREHLPRHSHMQCWRRRAASFVQHSPSPHSHHHYHLLSVAGTAFCAHLLPPSRTTYYGGRICAPRRCLAPCACRHLPLCLPAEGRTDRFMYYLGWASFHRATSRRHLHKTPRALYSDTRIYLPP